MEKYLVPRDIAERLSVSIETVWRWIREGKLTAISLAENKGYRIRQEDLEAFLNNKGKEEK